MRRAACLLALAGCAPSEPVEPPGTGIAPPDATTEDATPPWTVPATEPPAVDLAALGAALDAAIGKVTTLEPRAAFDAYSEVMAYRTATCPPPYGWGSTTTYYGTVDVWYATCATADGASFNGSAQLLDAKYGDDHDYVSLYATGSVLTPDGATWAADGLWVDSEVRIGAAWDRHLSLSGANTYDGPAAEGTWLAEALRCELEIDLSGTDGEARTVAVSGELSGLAGDVDTVAFADVALDRDAGCAEPAGTISVRTPAGDWYDLAFVGDGTPEGCDGCAPASWRGLALGEVCARFEPWTTWERP